MEESELTVKFVLVLLFKTVETMPFLIFLIKLLLAPCWTTYIIPSDVIVKSTGV